MFFDIQVVGGGLAGSEAAWQLAEAGFRVRLSEMRGGGTTTPAHQTDRLAEMVCSNSFRSDDSDHNAVGLLHQELRALKSLVMRSADLHRVPAGSALAVDRDGFAASITRAIERHPNIEVVRERLDGLPQHPAIIATGPLTGRLLAEAIEKETGQNALAFFDAIAPIVHRDSVDMDVAWMAARWDKGGKDYINCPLDKAQYERFVENLVSGEKMPFRDWEQDTPYFEGCMPIEVMAERGPETLRHGPMKPMGLDNPRTGRWPYAVVQIRQDNDLGTLWNMVGFQTKLKHGEQTRIFRTIPGLENAEFARLGGIHRNSFINSPTLLDQELRLRSNPKVRFAGQITGCEGYVESAAIGLVAALFASAELRRETMPLPPVETAIGALLAHITGGARAETFQPMNVNFGLMPAIEGRWKRPERKKAYTDRAREKFAEWCLGLMVREPA
ncbi:MAG TPA: methylenetetrahydrofolate--tRNA-(uracil(54)-C(5))-methyltransferase (FADH(2)-oxidizing) TrmFO [Sphingomicrobium sp.]|nr:methylenetetrahydrofolate--tRNA-(uracil(54)-C(5))-methyltransferase (FADH(2)-oxidizing) TrmFO [Sphingomicrobium sp.]